MESRAAAAERTIVAGVDGSERGADALALANLLARLRGARVLAVAVYRKAAPSDPAGRYFEADGRAAAGEWLAAVEADPEVDTQLRAVRAVSPARGLHELAESCAAELVVVGSTHRAGLGRVLPGAVGDRLLQESPCAVGIAPCGFAARAGSRPRVLAAGYDGSDESRAAVDLAAELAQAASATIRIVSVLSEGEPGDLRAQALEVRDGLPAALRAEARVVRGMAASELIDQAEQGVDLMVLGSRAYGPVGRALLGSVASLVVRDAPCPVVLVPRRAAASDRADEPPGAAASLTAPATTTA